MEHNEKTSQGYYDSIIRFPSVRFQMALVPADQIKPEKAMGLTREFSQSVFLHCTTMTFDAFRNWTRQ